MTIKFGVVMDPIGSINYAINSTIAFLWEAKARGWEIYYFEAHNLFLQSGVAYGDARLLDVFENENKWFEFKGERTIPLADLDMILMRKDPPVNEEFIYITQILDHAERAGVQVVNRPQGLRDANEKLFATLFPQCMAPTVVAQTKDKLHAFWKEHQDIVCKELNSLGGRAVYRLQLGDANADTLFTELTKHETVYVMAQKFLPTIAQGDKRILLIDGAPIGHAYLRIPKAGDWHGAIVAGATGVITPLTERDKWICNEIGPALRQHGLHFVGIDIIGDYLTEINVTSPACVRQISAGSNVNVCGMLFDNLLQGSKDVEKGRNI